MQFFVFIQITYLIDEAFNVGKGANAIISLLHHFFEHHGLGETEAFMHADNCSGQNKNKYMMQYLMWRVKSGLHTDITISFLPVGHTKFAPDWCFGLAKQTFRRTRVDTLDDIANSVSKSSFVNVPQLVGDLDGTCFVPMYDWAEFLEEHTIKTASKPCTTFDSVPSPPAWCMLRTRTLMLSERSSWHVMSHGHHPPTSCREE